MKVPISEGSTMVRRGKGGAKRGLIGVRAACVQVQVQIRHGAISKLNCGHLSNETATVVMSCLGAYLLLASRLPVSFTTLPPLPSLSFTNLQSPSVRQSKAPLQG